MEKEGYQTLDDTAGAPAVELQAVAPVQEKQPEPEAPKPQETAAPTPTPDPAPKKEETKGEEKKSEEKKQESKLEEKAQDVAVRLKNGYLPPGKPLRKFNRFAKAWAMLFFPIMLVHLGISLIYISQAYSFVTAAFANAGMGVQYLATSIIKQDALGFEYDYDTGVLTPGNPSWACNSSYPSGVISTKGLIGASLSCGTLLNWAGQPMLDNFPDFLGAKQRRDVPFFPNDGSKWMSEDLCVTFTPMNDYDSYAYDYLLNAVHDCEIANHIVPTGVQTWNESAHKFNRDSVKKPDQLAISMVYVYIFPLVAFVLLMAFFNQKYYLPWIKNVEPRSPDELLKVFFQGHPEGLFMASYQWNDHPTLTQTQMKQPENQKFQGLLPRKIAVMMPHSWLDIENLIPGTQIKPTCNMAAKNARFTFGFISEDYFKSANCGVEWTEIERRPGECILFAYPTTPKDKLAELEKMGHKIFKVEDVFDKMSPEWMLEYLLSSRQANFMFALKTPPINEKWLPTLRYYFPTPDWQWLKFNLPIILGYLLLLAWHIGWSASYRIFALYRSPSVGVLGVFAFFLPFIGILINLYFMVVTFGTGFSHPDLPDVCLLLYLLKRLDVIPTVKVYSNCMADTDPDVKILETLGIIKFVDEIMAGDVRVLNIDKLDDLPPPRSSDVIWASVGFMQLPQAVRDRIGSFIVGERIPSTQLEFIAVKVLMAAFGCPGTDSLDVGSNAFRQLKLKRVLD